MSAASSSTQASSTVCVWLQDLPDHGRVPIYQPPSEYDRVTNHFCGFDAAIEQNNRARALAESCEARNAPCKWVNVRGLYDVVPEEVVVRTQYVL